MTMTNEISEEQIRERAAQINERQAREELQAEERAKQLRAAQQAAQLDANYARAVATARREVQPEAEDRAERDELAVQAGAVIAKLAAVNARLKSRRAAALQPVEFAGRPVGAGLEQINRDIGLRDLAETDIKGDDAATAWAGFLLHEMSEGKLFMADDGRIWIDRVGGPFVYTPRITSARRP